jgi:hypothetical protein
MKKKCIACQSENLSTGALRLPGEAGGVYHQASESKGLFSSGASIVSLACIDCGHVQLSVDKEELTKAIS